MTCREFFYERPSKEQAAFRSARVGGPNSIDGDVPGVDISTVRRHIDEYRRCAAPPSPFLLSHKFIRINVLTLKMSGGDPTWNGLLLCIVVNALYATVRSQSSTKPNLPC